MNVHTGDGERKFITINSRPLLDYKKEMYGAVASFKDITRERLAEQALKHSEFSLKEIIKAISIQDRKAYLDTLTKCIHQITDSDYTFIGSLIPGNKIQTTSVFIKTSLSKTLFTIWLGLLVSL